MACSTRCRVWNIAAAIAMVVCMMVLVEGRYGEQKYKNAYATMMYMGTPRDYEYYVGTRVLMRSLLKFDVQADLVVIASVDVPPHWIRAMELEDGLKVVKVENVFNPYMAADDHDRFKLTMNKLYAWNLVEYDRVVMLDADNLFLQKTDELFQCGEFCAAFINPCIFHTGLFVLKPSAEVFKDMLHDLEVRRPNPDRADQGFIGGYFPNLLDKPMFHPPANGSRLSGTYRLPFGYQMDAGFYYLKLRWNVPCGPNSVVTFPSAVWMKPWYWWSWPTLPLGIAWHEQRRQTLGYEAEIPMVMIEVVLYLGLLVVTRLARPNTSRFCNRRFDKSGIVYNASLKILSLVSMIAAYIIPFYIIPQTVHPLVGWSLYLLGSFTLSSIVINTFGLPTLPVITPCLGIFGVLLVMAYPWYKDGIVRALAVFGYAFCAAPFLWGSLKKVTSSLQASVERETFLPSRFNESPPPPDFNKIT